MRRKLVHPWWQHLPAMGLLVGFVVYSLSTVARWPDRIAISMGWGGTPSRWAPPWVAFAMVVGLGILFIGLSALMDELWARQEGRKRFNPLTLLDEIVVGLLVGMQGSMMLSADGPRFSWPLILLCAGGGSLIAAWLESRRRPADLPGRVYREQIDEFREVLAKRVSAGERLVYWDVQNPAYVTWLSLGLPLVFWISAGLSLGSEPGASILLGVLGVVFVMFYGGQRTRVSRDEITIRYGIAGIRVLRCVMPEVTSVSVRSFSPLREFGGYGIRFSGSTTAYFLGGTRGVQVERSGKRSLLIGSSHPQRLAAVIAALRGVQVSIHSQEEG